MSQEKQQLISGAKKAIRPRFLILKGCEFDKSLAYLVV
jgi:hypothetical protein